MLAEMSRRVACFAVLMAVALAVATADYPVEEYYEKQIQPYHPDNWDSLQELQRFFQEHTRAAVPPTSSQDTTATSAGSKCKLWVLALGFLGDDAVHDACLPFVTKAIDEQLVVPAEVCVFHMDFMHRELGQCQGGWLPLTATGYFPFYGVNEDPPAEVNSFVDGMVDIVRSVVSQGGTAVVINRVNQYPYPVFLRFLEAGAFYVANSFKNWRVFAPVVALSCQEIIPHFRKMLLQPEKPTSGSKPLTVKFWAKMLGGCEEPTVKFVLARVKNLEDYLRRGYWTVFETNVRDELSHSNKCTLIPSLVWFGIEYQLLPVTPQESTLSFSMKELQVLYNQAKDAPLPEIQCD